MRTRSSLEYTIPRRRNRRRSRQQQEAIPIVDKFPIQMADDRPMAEQLQAPTGGFESAIVVPHINAQNFELKGIPELTEDGDGEGESPNYETGDGDNINPRPHDEEIISIEVSRQISPKVNSEPSIESPISSSHSLSSSEASEYSLDEFADELALIDFSSYPERDDMTTPDMSKEFVLDNMSFSPKELNLESLPKKMTLIRMK
ncbi:hypothetical protein Tco_0561560 [Tanacetum coccineum]